MSVLRQPDANTVQVVDAVKAALPTFQAQMPQSVQLTINNDRSVSIREALHDVTLTMLFTIVLVVLVIFLFLRRFIAHRDPHAEPAGVAVRRGGACCGASATPSTTSRCWA
jgi:HAE1 family hydrophobic/amphiphilic exporter-1